MSCPEITFKCKAISGQDKAYKTTDKYLLELDYDFIIKFEKDLRSVAPQDHHKPMGNNTVMKHIERFRKLVHLSQKLGWIERGLATNSLKFYVRVKVATPSETRFEN